MNILIIIILLVMLFIYVNYKVIFVSRYKVKSNKLPQAFNGFKILHLSDWHCTTYGKNNKRLINLINNKIKNEKIDIVVITGDFIIRQKRDYRPALEFISKIKSNNIYFVYGNHEMILKSKEIQDFKNKLETLGVVVLDDKKIELTRENQKLNLYGVSYIFSHIASRKDLTEQVLEKYKKDYEEKIGVINKNEYNILLSHDPMDFEVYVKEGFDLVFSGHLHGGGIRFFGIGVATARKNWFFTTLASGIHKKKDTQIIVSRGIGNSTRPIRIFDPPEISITTLYKTKS